MTRQEAVRKLAQYGIEGAEVYLIDLIPLIEMMWADGSIQKTELTVFKSYLDEHVERINRLAGREVLDGRSAEAFVSRFLQTRPDPALLKTLRSFIPALSGNDSDRGKVLASSLLGACLNIAASSASPLPYAQDSRFDPDERRCFFELLESFGRGGRGDSPLREP